MLVSLKQQKHREIVEKNLKLPFAWGSKPAVFSVIPKLVNLKCFLVKDALGPIHFTATAFLVPAPYQNGSFMYTG